jgi:hypothetical protein
MRTLRVLAKGVGIAIVAFLATWAITSIAASRRLVAAEQAWTGSLGRLDSVASRHPTAGANASALRAEELAGALGIDLRPRQVTDRPDPVAPHFPEAVREPQAARPAPAVRRTALFGLDTVRAQASTWAETQLERPDDLIDPPPPDVAAALETFRPQLDALCRHLVEAETPRWEDDLGALFQAPIPNLLAILNVQRFLTIDALVARLAGEPARTALRLEASWRLNESLRERVDVISQLVGVAVARFQAGTLRKLADAEPVWQERMAALDVTPTLIESLVAETWVFSKVGRGVTALWGRPDSWYDAPLSLAIRPAYVWWDATHRNSMRDAIELLREVLPCGHRLDPASPVLQPAFPFYEVLPKVVWPNVDGIAGKAARLHLDCRLTAAILAARSAQREDPGGAWPARLPDAVLAGCPDLPLAYATGPDGALTVTLEPRHDLGAGEPGLVLPTSFTATRTHPASQIEPSRAR